MDLWGIKKMTVMALKPGATGKKQHRDVFLHACMYGMLLSRPMYDMVTCTSQHGCIAFPPHPTYEGYAPHNKANLGSGVVRDSYDEMSLYLVLGIPAGVPNSNKVECSVCGSKKNAEILLFCRRKIIVCVTACIIVVFCMGMGTQTCCGVVKKTRMQYLFTDPPSCTFPLFARFSQECTW